jgi:pimeloyl-ACP methyl ester carboxylesterase
VLHLLERIPTMIVWGERDSIIPVAHARQAHRLIPGSRLEIIPRAGHFPYIDCPEWAMSLIGDFIATTRPACLTRDALEQALLHASDTAPAPAGRFA